MTASFFGGTGKKALGAYVVIWAASTAYIALTGGDWVFPIASLVIFGLILGALVWFLTCWQSGEAAAGQHGVEPTGD